MANQSIYNAFERMWQHTTAKLSEYSEVASAVNGIIIEVPSSDWELREDGTYTNTVVVEEVTGEETFDISLYGENITKEQAQAFDELVEWVDVQNGKVVFISYSEITTTFSVILKGKINFDEQNVVYAKDLISVNGIIVNIDTEGWELREDGYVKTIEVTDITGDETFDVSLYGEYTDEQSIAYDELVTNIETEDGKVVFTASEVPTVSFSVLLRGKINFKDKNVVYVSDVDLLSKPNATDIVFDDTNAQLGTDSVQSAIEALDNSVESLSGSMEVLNSSIEAITTNMGGVSLCPCTQEEYDEMESHDPSTIYIIREVEKTETTE